MSELYFRQLFTSCVMAHCFHSTVRHSRHVLKLFWVKQTIDDYTKTINVHRVFVSRGIFFLRSTLASSVLISDMFAVHQQSISKWIIIGRSYCVPVAHCLFHLFWSIECDFLLAFASKPNGFHHKMLLKINKWWWGTSTLKKKKNSTIFAVRLVKANQFNRVIASQSLEIQVGQQKFICTSADNLQQHVQSYNKTFPIARHTTLFSNLS